LPDHSEKTYLAELIRDFGTDKAIDPEIALRQIQSNYHSLEYIANNLIVYLSKNKDSFRSVFAVWTELFHRILFHGILNNAGKYRDASDKGGGIVLFGRDVHRKPFGSQFKGTHPDLIKKRDGGYF